MKTHIIIVLVLCLAAMCGYLFRNSIPDGVGYVVFVVTLVVLVVGEYFIRRRRKT